MVQIIGNETCLFISSLGQKRYHPQARARAHTHTHTHANSQESYPKL